MSRDFIASIKTALDDKGIDKQLERIGKKQSLTISKFKLDTTNLPTQIQGALDKKSFTINLTGIKTDGIETQTKLAGSKAGHLFSQSLLDNINKKIASGSFEASVERIGKRYSKAISSVGKLESGTEKSDLKKKLQDIAVSYNRIRSLQEDLDSGFLDDKEAIETYVAFNKELQKVSNNLTTVTSISTRLGETVKDIGLEDKMEKWLVDNANASDVYKNKVSKLIAELKRLSKAGDVPTEKYSEIENSFKEISGTVKLEGDKGGAAYTKAFIERIDKSMSSGELEAKIQGLGTKYQKALSNVSSLSSGTEKQGLETQLQSIEAKFVRIRELQTKLFSGKLGEQDKIGAYKELNEVLFGVQNELLSVNSVSQRFAKSTEEVALRAKLENWLKKNTKAAKVYGDEIQELINRLNALKESDSSTAKKELKDIDDSLTKIDKTADSLGLKGKSLGDSFKGAFKSISRYVSVSTLIFTTISAMRQGIQEIINLDTALVDLKKTTDASEQQLRSFYYTSNDIAKQLGITTEEVIQATADWSRLGYSIKDAEELAKTTSIFSAISPGTDIQKATDGLVSAMKAFDIDANDALDEIASKVNAIGNTQAVENQDIIEILTRSSAAMREANNTLDETIALGTAGLEITRDAEAMGTALKTLSLRIRGYDEETEEFIGNTAILSGEIADLTKTASHPAGISLFTDDSKTEFKSTVQILRDISEIYDELSDKQQAQLLEKLAGKRQAQAVAAILGNFETVEESLETMKNSAGGALREMEIIQESLEYKLNALKETAVGVFQNLFTKEDMKLVIEALTELLKLIDTLTEHLGLFGTASVGVGIYTLVKGFQSATASATLATGAVGGLGTALKVLGAIIDKHPILLAATIILGLASAVVKATGAFEDLGDKLATLKSEFSSNENEINSLNKELETTQKRIKELEGKGKLSFTEQEELDSLKRENFERERSIRLLEAQNKAKQEEINKTFVGAFEKDYGTKGEYFDWGGEVKGKTLLTEEDSVNLAFDKYKNVQDKLAQLEKDYADDLSNKKFLEDKERLESELGGYEEYINDELNNMFKLSEGIEYIPDPKTEDEKRVNQYLDMIGNLADKRAVLFGAEGAEYGAFERLVGTTFEKETESLRKLGEQGKVTSHDIASEEYSKFIDKLIEIGFISDRSTESLGKVALAFNETGDSAKKASDGVGELSNSLQGLANIEKLSAGFDQLDKIYADILDKADFDYSAIFNNQAFQQSFGNLDSYEDFIKTITNSPNDIKAVQEAFNQLSTEYINSSGVLKNLTEDNKKATIAMLEQMGVANASQLVDARLAIEKEKLAYATKITEKTTLDEAVAMVTEKNISNETRIAIAELALEKINVNRNTIQTSADISNILALANAANATAESLNRLERAKGLKAKSEEYNRLAAQGGTGGLMHKQAADRYALEAQALLDKPIEYEKFAVDDFKVNYTGGATSQKELDKLRKQATSSAKKAAKEAPEAFDFIEVALKKLERGIKNIKRVADSTYKSLSTRLGATKDEIDLVTNQIEVQQQAYTRYMQEANSVGLSSGLAKAVRDGAIDIQDYSKDTQALIKEYSEWYNKALDCADAVDELHESLASLYEDTFKNIQQDFDNQLSLLEHMTKSYETGLDMLEASGYLESTKYYTEMKNVQTRNIQVLEKELSQLEGAFSDAMASGEIEEYSESWYSMQNDINGVKEELAEANVELVKLDKNLRELDWKYFDYTQDRISQLTSEADFLIKLMESSDMYDDKGKLSDEGMATLGLHGQNYNVYMAQADKYAQEILKIDKELAEDPYNVDLIERREELLKLQQDSILAAEDEKQAIRDLIENGIKEELDSLKELIDTYNKSLDSAKDLYEYQKKIKEQTANIASLRKQISAYEADLSEETRAKVQKIEVELAKAEEELEETEYERYISDQKALLDELYLQYETVLNERLDNIDALIEDVIGTINDNSTSISDTLDRVSSEVGYTMTDNMKTIWNDSVGSINGVVSKYGDNFTNQFTSINLVLNAIEAHTQAMVNASDAKAKETISSSNSKPVTKPSGGSKPAPKPSKPSTPPPKKVKVGGKINAGNALIYDYAGDPSGERQYYRRDPVYVVLDEQGGWVKVRHHKLKSGVTGWFKKSDIKAYKKGGLVNYTGLAQVDGTPGRPESFLNANDTKLLAQLTQTLSKSANAPLLKSGVIGNTDLSDIVSLCKASNIGNGSVLSGNNVTFGDTIINIDHVEDYNDLVSKMQKDKQFEKMITSMTVGRVMGKSELDKYKYKWR